MQALAADGGVTQLARVPADRCGVRRIRFGSQRLAGKHREALRSMIIRAITGAVGSLLALLLLVPAAYAHESRPAYLQLTETAPGQFNVLWRTPVLSGNRLPVVLQLPDSVRNSKPPVVQELTDSLLERRWIDAGTGGLAGQRIEFPGLQLTITDVLVRFELLDGTKGTVIVRPTQPWFEIKAAQSGWDVAGGYLRLGIEHIWSGLDHLLFVLALLLLVHGWKRVVATITAFTIAHSISLVAATLGFVRVPGPPVEAAIALSIVFVAAEILRAREGHAGLTTRWPWLVAFIFGLLHGLGFAGALNEVGLPQTAIPIALLFFNLGVEAGQLMFIALFYGVATIAGRLSGFVTLPQPAWGWRVAPYTIGCVASFWFMQRIAAF